MMPWLEADCQYEHNIVSTSFAYHCECKYPAFVGYKCSYCNSDQNCSTDTSPLFMAFTRHWLEADYLCDYNIVSTSAAIVTLIWTGSTNT